MRGPASLGRSVVVAPGQQPPPEWRGCRRAGESTDELEQAWRDRTPLVIEVGAEPPADEVERGPVWSLAPSFTFPGERRAHASFANAVDARGGRARWYLADEAVRLGAAAARPGDVVAADVEAADVVRADVVPADGVLADVVPADVVPADVVPADGVLADVVLADGTPAFCDGARWSGAVASAGRP